MEQVNCLCICLTPQTNHPSKSKLHSKLVCVSCLVFQACIIFMLKTCVRHWTTESLVLAKVDSFIFLRFFFVVLLFQNNRLETIVFMKTLTFIQMICFWFVQAHSPMFSVGPLCGIYTCFWQQFLFFWCFLPHPDLKSMFLNFLQNMSNLI